MGQKWQSLNENHINFIREQHMFFVATAPKTGHINLSPKGLDSLRVLSPDKVIWLNLTGSGNETAAHLLEDNRITLMFNSFGEKPLILRIYGTASSIHPQDKSWEEMVAHFPDYPAKRQIIAIDVELVHTSCGFGVPLYEFAGQRPTLEEWAAKKGEDGIRTYQQEKNETSMDGKPIGKY